MGLDQNIISVPIIECPHCKVKYPARDPNQYDIDPYQYNDGICYWRKNWDLHHYIHDNIHKYDEEEYGTYIRLSTEDLILIRKYGKKDPSFGYENLINLDQAIVKSMNEEAAYYYEADW